MTVIKIIEIDARRKSQMYVCASVQADDCNSAMANFLCCISGLFCGAGFLFGATTWRRRIFCIGMF